MKTTLALTLVPACLLVLATGCKTGAPPSPAPTPVGVPAQEIPEEKSAPPYAFVRVTGSKLNVREGPALDKPTIAKVKRGDKLPVVGQDGEWFQVRLANDKLGWVHGKYVTKDQPCQPDKTTAELLNAPPMSFTQGASLGRVVLEATVDSTGSVTRTKVVQDTTGDAALAKKADDELKQLRFSPPVRRCRPLPFVYTYTRNF